MSAVYFGILFVAVCLVHCFGEIHRNKLADVLGTMLDKLERIEGQLDDIKELEDIKE
jgi:hypothetical protein